MAINVWRSWIDCSCSWNELGLFSNSQNPNGTCRNHHRHVDGRYCLVGWLVGWLLLLLLNCIWNIPSCSVVVFAMTVMAPMVIGNVVDVDVDVDGIVLLGILQYQPEC
jgi:hypothetical protein